MTSLYSLFENLSAGLSSGAGDIMQSTVWPIATRGERDSVRERWDTTP